MEPINNDVWTDDEYNEVIDKVKDGMWKYVKEGSIEQLQNLVQNITRLNDQDLNYLAIIHFLLSDEVKEFITSIPQIFRRMSHSSRQQVEELRGMTRSRIDWNLTLRSRLCRGNDQTLFICKPPIRVYDLPENQLFKFVLQEISILIQRTTGLLNISDKDIDLAKLQSSDNKNWKDRVSWIKYNVNRALRNVYLEGIIVPIRPNTRMIRRARFARNKRYQKILVTHIFQDKIIRRLDVYVLRQLVEKTILLPIDRDVLFELYVLLETMNALGEPKELSLIKSGAEEVGTFDLNGETIKLYFQKVSGLFEFSKYK